MESCNCMIIEYALHETGRIHVIQKYNSIQACIYIVIFFFFFFMLINYVYFMQFPESFIMMNLEFSLGEHLKIRVIHSHHSI